MSHQDNARRNLRFNGIATIASDLASDLDLDLDPNLCVFRRRTGMVEQLSHLSFSDALANRQLPAAPSRASPA
jgi:hypothetical protein